MDEEDEELLFRFFVFVFTSWLLREDFLEDLALGLLLAEEDEDEEDDEEEEDRLRFFLSCFFSLPCLLDDSDRLSTDRLCSMTTARN